MKTLKLFPAHLYLLEKLAPYVDRTQQFGSLIIYTTNALTLCEYFHTLSGFLLFVCEIVSGFPLDINVGF